MRVLAVDVNGELVQPPRVLDGIEAYTQRLRHRLGMIKGSWFLDLRIGFPYFEHILGHDPNLRAVKNIITAVIMKTPETDSVIGMNVALDRAARHMTVTDLEVVWKGVRHSFQSEIFIVDLGTL